jgi:hypothetical protein
MQFLKNRIRALVESLLAPSEARIITALKSDPRTAPATKIAQRQLFHYYQSLIKSGQASALADTGFRVFSQFEEDGKLLFIFAALGVSRGTFVDVGAADGINSNCANLALNFGWSGVFIEGNPGLVRRGEEFYKNHPDTWAHPPKFIHGMVKRENINELLSSAMLPRDIDFMSVDIDGNDYWVWDAIDCIDPKVVMIETHIEFGLRPIVVPYNKDYVYPGVHPDYHGASPLAMMKLADKKGYRLVGSNAYGFNTIYVRRGLAEKALPEVTVDTVLAHPRNAERAVLFEPIKGWKYVTV